MNKYLITFGAFALIAIMFASLILLQNDKQTNKITPMDTNNKQSTDEEITDTSIANPASQHCIDNGGSLEIVTASDGSQIGLCQFDGYACEEWAFYNGECPPENDAENIKDIHL